MSLQELKEPIDLNSVVDTVYKNLSLNSLIKHFTTYELIVYVMELVENINNINKRELVLSILNRLAKGKDGVVGTDDDLISKETLNSIKLLLESELVEGFVEVLIKATKGKVNINKIVDRGCSIFTCFRK